jgi:dedicator of cytokinesis protein 1
MQFEVSPLENAVETLESKNQNIKSLIDQHRSDPSLRVDSLSMQLQGVVDAAVNGGISNYKVSLVFCIIVFHPIHLYFQVFFSEEYDTSPASRDLVKLLRRKTTMQVQYSSNAFFLCSSICFFAFKLVSLSGSFSSCF